MNQKKVKKIRKSLNLPADMPYAVHEFVPYNMDLRKRIERAGIETITRVLGYTPLTSVLVPGCKKYKYKEAKRL